MSFRQNGRYGHVPPAQYHPGQETGLGIQRRSSFDNGDDASFFQGAPNGPPAVPAHLNTSASPRGPGSGQNDELYLTGPAQDPRPPPARPPYPMSSPGLSGYQHQYQPPPSSNAAATTPVTPVYNPQQFARTYSQSQPPATPYNPQVYHNQNYTNHQPYNPAAYQQASLQRQPTMPSYVQTPVYASPQAPQSATYWAPPANYGMTSPTQPISQQVYDQPLHSPPYNAPGSAPLPPRPSPYSPPVPSSPYSTNGAASYVSNNYAATPTSQAPYPTQSQMPAGDLYSSTYDDSTSFSARVSRSSSHNTNPLPSPPIATEPSNPSLQRHPTHRPLPSAPVEQEQEELYDEEDEDEEARLAEQRAQEQIYQEIEAAVGSGSSHARSQRSQTLDQSHPDLLDSELGELQRYNSRATTLNPTAIDRYGSSASTLTQNTQEASYDYDYDDSDAEAAAGLEAMRIAEEEEARRGSGGFGPYDSSRPQQEASQDASSDSDYANVDMGLYGGGYDAHMSYGGDLTLSNARHSSEMDDQSRPLPTPDDLHRTEGHEPAPGLGGMTDYSMPSDGTIHPFPAFDSRVDSFGTGGLQRPDSQGHRLSFDEGDERASIGSRFTESRLSGRSGSESPSRDDMPDMFYHPGMSTASTGRPLPAVPTLAENRTPQLQPAGSYRNPQPYVAEPARPYYVPDGPDAYDQDMTTPVSQFVPRSASLTSHSSTPQIVPPARSRTDAEERQARQRALRQQGISGAADGYDAGTPQTTISLDLPALPVGARRKKVNAQTLKSADFKKCRESWALSGIAEWVRDMCGGETGEGETDLKERTIIECLTVLFTHKVPTMNTADAEGLSERVVKEMFDAGVLIRDEEWVKFGHASISGVLWQLTGSGCYAPKLHEVEIHGRCYSHHCSRTLKKINLQTQALEPSRKLEPWHVFFKLTKEQIDKADKKEVQRQNNLHEIVMSEDVYMDRLNVLRILYRDTLQKFSPAIIAPAKMPNFINKVFGKVEAIKHANEDHLLAPLKYRQQEQGPWIVGFSDIFREWIRKARQVYMDYAAGYPYANYMVRREADKNSYFKQFLDQARDNKLSDRLDWNTYLFAPLKRLQQYTLLLREVLKHSLIENEEKTNLMTAIEEINNVTLECDAKVDEMAKKVEMIELSSKLFLRPGMERVELNLDHLGRELIFKGDLQRAGANRFTWLETHALLFDHYLVLAKPVQQREGAQGAKRDVYDVSKLPIPMQLLVLESTNDEAVVKSSVKGLGAVTTVTRQAPQQPDPRLTRTSTSSERPGLEHTASNTSTNTTGSSSKMVTSTNLESDARIMYPFRIKHLGKSEVYTLYAPTSSNRQDWCDKIIEAKERHAASLYSQHAEPFRLKVLADSAFAYETSAILQNRSGIIIKGTPLDRAIRNMEREYGNARPAPVCRAMVNCATTFTCYGKSMIAIGTDFGVYTAEVSNPRGWTRSIQMSRVSQIAVLEDFNLCLIIADKALIAYHLDVVVPVSNFPAPQHTDSARRAPQKLSGARDVAFFATARMKDRTLVFYKKREGLSSTFKVLEPILQKSTEKKSKLFSRSRIGGGGNTEFFREFDEFYIPADCFSINLFHTYIAISTARGFELLTLDKKVPMSIPDLKQPSIASIAARLSGQKPLGMFRLSDAEFLLCYEECGVYIDKHGEVSRSVVLEFVGKAKTAAMYGAYLVLFDNDFVEVRNADNGRLRQVIAGKDVRCLDHGVPVAGQNGQRTLKLAMAHPELTGSQLILEMVLNEGQRE